MTLPPGWRLEVHEALASTSDRVAAAAEAGEPAGLAVLARRQTAGRGRSGRAWASPHGNLYLSLLLRPPGPVREAGQWSLLAGVALAEAARALDPEPLALRLKWPNDLLRHGAKCAGILTESALAADGDPRLGQPRHRRQPGGGAAAAGPADRLPRRRRGAGGLRRPAASPASTTGPGGRRPRASPRSAPPGPPAAPTPARPLTLSARPGRPRGRFAGLAEDGGLLLEAGGPAPRHPQRRDPASGRRGPEAMLLAIDAGNTNVVFAVHDGREWRGRWRIATRAGPHLGRIRGLAAGAAAALPA